MDEFKLGTCGTDDIAVAAAPEILTKLLRIPGAQMRYSADMQWLSAPASRLSVLCVEAAGHPTSMSDSYQDMRAKAMRPTDEQMAAWLAVRPPMKRKLLEHQDNYCAWALNSLGCLNASEQGTGKTIMTIAHLGTWRKLHGISRVLIVGPKSPLAQWENELYTTLPEEITPLFIFLGDSSVPVVQRKAILQGLKEAVAITGDFVAAAINYDVLADMEQEIIDFNPDVIVFDESWRIKTPTAAVTKSAARMCKALRKRNSQLRVVCLNGTPYTKDVGDLWSQLVVCTNENLVGKYNDWMNDYSNQTLMTIRIVVKGRNVSKDIVKYSGIKDPVGLMSRLSSVYWRATKDSCLDLPEKLPEQRVNLKVTHRVFNLYKAVMDLGEQALLPSPDAWEEIDENMGDGECLDKLENINLAGAITKTLRLQQICSGFLPVKLTYGVEFDLHNIIGNDCDLLKKEHTGLKDDVFAFDTPKIEWLKQFINDRLMEDKQMRVIIWCNFNYDVYNTSRLVERMLGEGSVIRVVGGPKGIKDRDLEDAKLSFNSKSPTGIRVICAQTQRLAFGHNLQGCDHNIIYSHPWSYLLKDQLEDRSHRYGRQWPVAYTSLISTYNDVFLIDDLIVRTTDAHEDVARKLARDTTAMRKRQPW